MVQPPDQFPSGSPAEPNEGWSGGQSYGSGYSHGAGMTQPTCAWHSDRPTGLSCSRCGRPACPQCLTPAAVGQLCRDCRGNSVDTRARTVAGSVLGEKPVVAFALIAINVLIFLVTAIQAKSPQQLGPSKLFSDWVLIPGEVADGEYWRLLTSGFLHLDLMHVAANMISLFFLGPPLERMIGRVRFLVVYLISLLGGSAAVMLFAAPLSAAAGASGAIFGLMGALVVTFKRLKLDLRSLAMILVLNLFITFQVPGISWQAHLGGLVAGAAIGAAMVLPTAARRKAVQLGASVALTVVLLAVSFVKAGSIDPADCAYYENGPDGPGTYCRH